MSESEYNKNELITERIVKLKNIKLNNSINNRRMLPLISEVNFKKSLNTLFLPPQANDNNLINFYKKVHSNNKPLDNIPNNFQNKRFIILNIETNLGQNNNTIGELLSINAMEIINCELTGIQFHSYFKNENGKIKDYINTKNSENNSFFYYLLNYFIEREDYNKKLLQQLLNFIGDSMIICHNALYTIRFINKELKKYNLPEIPINKCICTLRMMRLKNYNNSNDKIKGLEINDLFNYYNISFYRDNIDNNNELKALALSICVTRMILDEIKNKDNNFYNNNDKDIGDDYLETYENEQKNDIYKFDYLESQNNSNRQLKKQNILKLTNNNIQNNIFNLAKSSNNIYNVIQNNKKEFDKKYKIAKSFNKYQSICNKTDSSNNLTLLDNNSFKMNNFIKGNFINQNSLINKDIIFNKKNIIDNKIKFDNIK